MLDPERQLELVDLLLVGEMGEDCGATAVLEGGGGVSLFAVQNSYFNNSPSTIHDVDVF